MHKADEKAYILDLDPSGFQAPTNFSKYIGCETESVFTNLKHGWNSGPTFSPIYEFTVFIFYKSVSSFS